MTTERRGSAKPIRILIAEDHIIARAGVEAIINAQPDMNIVAEAGNGEQALALYRKHRPDIILMDMRMPVMDGFAALSVLRREFPDVRVVALSTFGGDEDIRRALNAGAQAYLTKDVLPDELIAAIRAVHAGERYLPELVLAMLAAEMPRLSERELEVLRLVAQGLSNKRVAHVLNIAEDTAKNHVKNILKKLGADDRTQAATEAIQRGIIHL
ncbi:MAG TPA: response regulator transcription factor [Bryobacteraceae bacterium]